MNPKVLAVGILLLWADASFAVSSCLKYDPAAVELTGTVKRATFAVPPVTGMKKSPRQEQGWVLQLPAGICVEGSPRDAFNADTEHGIAELQLIVVNSNAYRSLQGRRVAVKGRLLHAYNWHHHTPVLFQVEKLRAAAD